MPLFHDPSFGPFLRTLFPGAFNVPFSCPRKKGGAGAFSGGIFRGTFPRHHCCCRAVTAANLTIAGENDWNCARATAGQAGPWPGRGWASARYSW